MTTTKTPTRVYLVSEFRSSLESVGTVHLVRAVTPAQAIRHVARNRYQAEVAGQDELIQYVSAGVKVQTAGEDEA